MRFTIRRLLILIAVVGLGLGARNAKLRYDHCHREAARCDAMAKLSRDQEKGQLEVAAYWEHWAASQARAGIRRAEIAEGRTEIGRTTASRNRAVRPIVAVTTSPGDGAVSPLSRAEGRLPANGNRIRGYPAMLDAATSVGHQILTRREEAANDARRAAHLARTAALFRAAATRPWTLVPRIEVIPAWRDLARHPLQGVVLNLDRGPAVGASPQRPSAKAAP